MPRDKRLYMTFPIDFWQHPKIAPLSDAAFRAFVEVNGYSRMQDLDGRIPIVTARRMWKPKVLAELVSNHPERPSMSVEGDDYLIWNYSEHQLTKADRERLAEVSRTNGARGGRPKRNLNETQSGSESNPNESRVRVKSQSQESEKDFDDITNVSESSHLGDVAESRHDYSDMVIAQAERAGIRNLEQLHVAFSRCCGPISATGTIELALAICSRSKHRVEKVDSYVLTACTQSPDDVRWDYERLDLAVA